MKICRLKIVSADTSKKDYVMEVKRMLDFHDASDHNKSQHDNYRAKAKSLLGTHADPDKVMALLLSS